ncbi:MAG: MaoC family dehydratase N-terminal domain-containing protein [Lachnospiraceae bacterium]|nr:MaoC family dehydratase N-terminal domain-containing protein [Lachnospiraceae bacterium]
MMNTYDYEDLETGHREEFETEITDSMLDSFRILTGDDNPFHRDDEFAKAHGFKGHAAFGMLTASFLSTLAGMYLPGEKSIIQNTELKFMKPVYPGDRLIVSGEVAEKNDAYRVIRVKVMIKKYDGEKVLRGSMQIGFL